VGAIKIRAQKLGATPHVESALDRGRRLQKEAALRAEREEQLQKSGNAAFQAERDAVFSSLAESIEKLREELPSLQLEYGAQGNDFAARGKGTSINGYGYQTYPITESRFVVREFKGRLILPTERGKGYSREPREIGKMEFYFDYDTALGGWCWKPRALWMASEPITTPQVVDNIVMRLLELENKYDKGEIRWRDDE
jgi:hypothetical protein